MCNNRKDNDNRLRDLTHVKILTMYASNLTDISKGIYLDNPFYRFENATPGKSYLFKTIKIEGVWVRQQ